MHHLFKVILFFLFVARTFSQLHDQNSCYRQYIPPQQGFPQARCRGVIGGNPAQNGLFIRNAFTCCKRRLAGGWGNTSGCQACSSIRGVLRPWGEWSMCSKTCGRGEQKRYRYCSNGVCAGVSGRRLTEVRTCVWKACCPVDGNWGTWSHWSDCSASCEHGLQYRTRSCSSPAPFCGGRPCRSYPRQMQRCSVGDCASWTSWVPQSSCSVTCGIGTLKRQRTCHNPLGDDCIGEAVDYLSCDRGSCAVNGNWCGWSHWSSCTSTCQHTKGTRKRSRSCDCPRYRNGGKECPGSDGEVEQCHSNDVCYLEGKLSEWSSWGMCSSERCSKTPGRRVRTRTCHHETLQGDYVFCKGEMSEEESCINLDGCRIEGTYGKWSTWSPCTLSCGSCGAQTRSRNCFREVDVPNTKILGNPEIFCNYSKELSTKICNAGICPDGSNPCSETNDYEEKYIVPSIFDSHYSMTNDGESYTYEASAHADYDTDYSHSFGSGNDYNEPVNGLHLEDGNVQTDLSLNTFFFDGATPETEFHLSKDLLKMSTGGEIQATTDRAEIVNDIPSTKNNLDSFPIQQTGEGSASLDGNWNYNPAKELVAGCTEASVKGGEFARCCEFLSLEITNDTSAEELQKCFIFHFEHIQGIADDMSTGMLDNPFGRGVSRRMCKYSGKLLKTICCLTKECTLWKKPGLRNQCINCWKNNRCPSCHTLLLSG